jgi:hypothetical protein
MPRSFLETQNQNTRPEHDNANHSLQVGRLWRKMAAKIATSSRLSLSTGTTFEASPTFNAQK